MRILHPDSEQTSIHHTNLCQGWGLNTNFGAEQVITTLPNAPPGQSLQMRFWINQGTVFF